MTVRTNGQRITRDDLEASFSRVISDGEATAQAAVPQGLVVVGAVALVIVVLTYVLGRRRGRKTSAVVEIRRL